MPSQPLPVVWPCPVWAQVMSASDRKAVLAALLQILESYPGGLRVRVECDRGQLASFDVLALPAPPAPAEAAKPADPPAPKDVRAAILSVASARPRIGKSLARLAGYTYGSHFRKALAALTREGKLKHTPDGYVCGAVSGGDT